LKKNRRLQKKNFGRGAEAARWNQNLVASEGLKVELENLEFLNEQDLLLKSGEDEFNY
jgi:hypothetical protein